MRDAFVAGVEWAVDNINAAGGIDVDGDKYVIEVVKCDTKFLGSQASTCATMMVYDEEVHYLIGPIETQEAMAPVLVPGKAINGIIAACSERFINPEYPYTFIGLGPSELYADGFFKQMIEFYPDIASVAIIGPATSAGDDNVRYADEAVTRWYNAEVVETARWEPGVTDFYPQLTPIVAKNPDALIICGGGSGEQDLIVKQVRELGFEGQLVGPWHGTEEPLVELVGAEVAEGMLINEPVYWSELYPEATRALYAEYQELYPGADLGLTHYLGYGNTMLIKQAIEEAGSIDPDMVVQVFDDPNWTFEWFGMPGHKLGGLETYGIRRVHPDEICLSIVKDGTREALSREPLVVP